MKTLKIHTSAVEADADRAILEANGIRCFLADERSSVVGVGALGLRLQVDDADVPRASDVLKNHPANQPLATELGDELSVPDYSPNKADWRFICWGVGIVLLVMLWGILRELFR